MIKYQCTCISVVVIETYDRMITVSIAGNPHFSQTGTIRDVVVRARPQKHGGRKQIFGI